MKMLKSIGLLELTSIACGIECADYMVKAADVELIMCGTVCPGKYVILFAGDIAAVQASLEVGREKAREFFVGDFTIASVHGDVIAAINKATVIDDVNAVGVIETFSIASAIEGADAAVKAAEVQLIELRLGVGIGGKAFFTFSGDVAAVQAAKEAGERAVAKSGTLVASIVIPYPSLDLFEKLL